MLFIVSQKVLDAVLREHKLKPNDLTGIDKLFGGADGYYWYHTMRHMCGPSNELVWTSVKEMRNAIQGHENETAAEDEVKPQTLRDEHVAAIAKVLGAEA